MSVRAGIVVTGTEVLSGRVTDRNGPWLAERLEELGVDLAEIAIVADRREDLLATLRHMAERRFDLVLTSGGLGPTADDLTAEVVAELQGRELVWDEPLQERIEAIVARLGARWRNVSAEAMRVGCAQAGDDPGWRDGARAGRHRSGPGGDPGGGQDGPTVVVLPGPPRELQPMWQAAVRDDFAAAGPLREALAGATTYRRRTLRLFGIPESAIAETLRAAEHEGVELERLEVTTCLKRGEVEVVTRYEPDAQPIYDALVAAVREHHIEQLFSEDGSTIDEQVAALLRGERGVSARTIATAESCTGGLLAARLTDLPGASAYMRGAIVAYANEAKVALAGVPAALLQRHGAVSAEVAEALAKGARKRLEADVGVGITGVAGPDGGTEQKPVGTVCLSIIAPEGSRARTVTLPGGRQDIRERATTVALHLVRQLLAPKANI